MKFHFVKVRIFLDTQITLTNNYYFKTFQRTNEKKKTTIISNYTDDYAECSPQPVADDTQLSLRDWNKATKTKTPTKKKTTKKNTNTKNETAANKMDLDDDYYGINIPIHFPSHLLLN